jgi:hypothetical protein
MECIGVEFGNNNIKITIVNKRTINLEELSQYCKTYMIDENSLFVKIDPKGSSKREDYKIVSDPNIIIDVCETTLKVLKKRMNNSIYYIEIINNLYLPYKRNSNIETLLNG